MRRIAWIALILCGLIVTAASIEAAVAWRRTSQGWQRLNVSPAETARGRATLHPAIVAALEVLLTLTACVACSPNHTSPKR